jgi:hypothetical protein
VEGDRTGRDFGLLLDEPADGGGQLGADSPSDSTTAWAISGSIAPCASAFRAAQQPTGTPSGGVMSTLWTAA